ncbi:hypothetical protein DCS_06249 [Drechmeria coniospora]|uniref:Uncharacterized protein n=1 Tax=Drechmeria coniospora TaxID=98403 RepID=A0A151GB09_DRECN|nr:hypothetical protein DCS_06249 [Drechmeria coniospora]KYK54292.1 hypothetical protein DCS_06249 [Drechmeria coniospora]
MYGVSEAHIFAGRHSVESACFIVARTITPHAGAKCQLPMHHAQCRTTCVYGVQSSSFDRLVVPFIRIRVGRSLHHFTTGVEAIGCILSIERPYANPVSSIGRAKSRTNARAPTPVEEPCTIPPAYGAAAAAAAAAVRQALQKSRPVVCKLHAIVRAAS